MCVFVFLFFYLLLRQLLNAIRAAATGIVSKRGRREGKGARWKGEGGREMEIQDTPEGQALPNSIVVVDGGFD